MSKPLVQTTGRRKAAIARVRVREGSGTITINKRSVEDYFPSETHRMILAEPLRVAEQAEAFDIDATIHGGGPSGQAGALRLGIARALVALDPEQRPALKAAGFLSRDAREKESKKYGLKKARKEIARYETELRAREIEAAEALRHAGLEVTVVEAAPHVLPVVDPEIAAYVSAELRRHGVAVHEGTAATRIEDRDGLPAVELDDGTTVATDLVVLSVGVRPRTELARAAGLALSEQGAILVDEHQRTSDPHIWAVGDATASLHAVTDTLGPVALATPANRGGRVAADSIMGRGRPSPRPLGTAIVRVFDLAVAMTGASRGALGERAFHTARVHAGHHAGYYPGAQTMHLLLHFDEEGRILGAQGVGAAGIDKRIDVIATAARAGVTADDLVDLDLCYAPPFGSAKDPVLMLGMIADNVLTGQLVQHEPTDGIDSTATLVLDVRNLDEWDRGHVDGAVHIPPPQVSGSVERIRELADGRPVVVHCASGFRSYLAHRTLAAAGIPSANLSGGFFTLDVLEPQVTTPRLATSTV